MPAELTENAALIVVDVQADFMPGGPLPCHQGDAILAPLARLMRQRRFRHLVATQDWHPAGHASFASSHPGRQPFETIQLHGHTQILWPEHCVEGRPGAALHPAIDWTPADLILRKGRQLQVDSYSAFRENVDAHGQRQPTGLAGWLRERGVSEVWVAGLARDYCVLWTAEDARAEGFRTRLCWDLSRPADADSDAAVRASCTRAGIEIADVTPDT